MILWDLPIRNSFCRNLLERSAALWYNDVNNLIRCGEFGGYNVACHGQFGADLSKDFSKKVLEIVLEADFLARLGF